MKSISQELNTQLKETKDSFVPSTIRLLNLHNSLHIPLHLFSDD